MDTATRVGVYRYVAREYVGVVFLFVLLGLASGRWDHPEAFAIAGLYAAWVTATIALVAPRCPELLAERAERRHPDAKPWDRVLLGLFGMETMARYAVGGLDLRYGWSAGFPTWLQLAGGALAAAGFAMVTWSMVANAWFSMVVRLQKDRGQRVATGGPYAWVRHPGYVGTCAFEVGTGMVLGSWPAVALGLVGVGLLVVRTALEDRMLHAELDGYPAYAAKVRWRLVPGLF